MITMSSKIKNDYEKWNADENVMKPEPCYVQGDDYICMKMLENLTRKRRAKERYKKTKDARMMM